ncbi:head-tail connector protein [Roseibium litorale]|uniref:Phage head-tail connector protein n=1 Tax=Roseibium litorale TaxID=2803841 RepID=A0ABR9CRK8_9HYPH|nr:phage head-tail connector protein [Roseibium litorale]MBD8893498.1 phage head-tail connector protein [Roseibium litorale]
MTATRVIEPVVEPVTLTEMKAHLRLTGTVEDAFLEQLIASARAQVEQETRRALITQSWRLYLDGWPLGRVVQLPVAPVQGISQILVFDEDGVPHALSEGDWRLDKSTSPARIRVKPGAGLPSSAVMSIEIDFTAGYGTAASDVPADLRQSVRLLAAHWFEYREAGTELAMASMPHGLDRLLAANRVRLL